MVIYFFITLVNKDHHFLNKRETKKFTFLLNLLMCSSHDSKCVLEDVNFGTLATAFPFEGERVVAPPGDQLQKLTQFTLSASRVTACKAIRALTNIRENEQCRQVLEDQDPHWQWPWLHQMWVKPLFIWLPHLEKKAENLSLLTQVFFGKG